jgi:general secretion pathway protein I
MSYLPTPRVGPRAARRWPRRAGLTLLEVVISLAIFLFALAAISQLIRIGGDMAMQAQFRQHAVFLCQAKLAEFAAGVVPMSSQGNTPCDDPDGDWQWSANCDNSTATGLWTVQVTVTGPQGASNPVSITVTRMWLDPTIRGNTMDTPQELSQANGASNSTNSSSSSGSSSSSSSSSGTGGGM